MTAKSVNPRRTVCLIKSIGDGVIPCAIPYMIETLADPAHNAMPDTPLRNAKVRVIVDTVVAVDREHHSVTLAVGGDMTYQKLVLATGTTLTLPPIPGIDRRGVYTITKSMSEMMTLREKLRKAHNVAIIGGGFIGTELADELSRVGNLNIHLVELELHLLTGAMDDEFCVEAAAILQQAGVSLHTGQKVTSIGGPKGEGVESITLADGTVIDADAVLIGIGRPTGVLAGKGCRPAGHRWRFDLGR